MTDTDLLRRCFETLNESGIEYCVSNSYDALDSQEASDIDCSVHKAVTSRTLVEAFLHSDIQVVQVFQRESTAAVHVVVDARNAHPEFLWFDVSSDFRQNGSVFCHGNDLLEGRSQFGTFWIPRPSSEFGHYLAKKIVQGSLSDSSAQRLSELFSRDPAGCSRYLERLWPDKTRRLLVAAASSCDWTEVRSTKAILRAELHSRAGRYRPIKSAIYWVPELFRRLKRLCQPTGLQVVFLGPDGCGKSTVIKAVESRLAPAFRHTCALHLMPGLFRKPSSNDAVVDPHGMAPRNIIGSVAKLLHWLVDYSVGYYVKVRPALSRSTLVLFDRYFLDAIVDPRRYRYGATPRLIRLIWWFVPKPDLILLLDAPAEVLQQRKQEVSYEETHRARSEYLRLFRALPDGHIVDASQPLSDVVRCVEMTILNHLAARTKRRLGISPSPPVSVDARRFIWPFSWPRGRSVAR